MFRDLILKNRSYRRFYQSESVERSTLIELVDLARLSASASNKQPLRYLVYSNPEANERIFGCLAWAGYLKDWGGPPQGERPAGYIVILGDTAINPSFGCDHGIAAQSILLGAVEKGLGGCMLGAIDRQRLRQELELAEQYKILLVIALGKPKEQVVLDEVDVDADIKYWRDGQQVHHVPKRRLADIILN